MKRMHEKDEIIALIEEHGGGGSTPTNMMTTDTAQTITGSKTFTKSIDFPRDGTWRYVGDPHHGLNISSTNSGGEISLESDNVAIEFGDSDTKGENGSFEIYQYFEDSDGSSCSAKAKIHVMQPNQDERSEVDLVLPAQSGTIMVISNNSIKVGNTVITESQLRALLALLG